MPGQQDKQELIIELKARADQLQQDIETARRLIVGFGEEAEKAGRVPWDRTVDGVISVGEALDGVAASFGDVEREQRAALSQLQDAGEDVTQELRRIDAAAEDVADALRKVERDRSLKVAGEQATKAAAAIKEAARFAGQLSDETRKAGDQGSEAARRISTAFENASERIRRLGKDAQIAEGLLEDLGESPRENLAAANTESERALVLLGQLANVTKRLEEEAGEGLGSFADNAAKGRQTINQLRDSVERLGDDASPVLRRELRRLEGQFEQTFERGKKEVVELERELGDLEAELRRGQTGFFDLQDGLDQLTRRFPRLSKAVGGAVSAAAAFQAAYQGTRELIAQIKELTGVDIDAGVQRFFDDLLSDWDKYTAGAEEAAESTDYLRNARKVLIARGREFVDTERGIRAAMEELNDELFRSREASTAAAKFFDDLRGFTADETRQGIANLVEVFARLRTRLQRDPEALAAFREQVDALIDRADRLGSELDDKTIAALRRLDEQLKSIDIKSYARQWQELGAESAEAVDRQAESILELGNALLGYQGEIQVTATVTTEQADLIVAKIDEILESIQLLPTTQREARAAQVAELDRVRAAYARLSTEGQEAAKALRDGFLEAAATIGNTLGETFGSLLDQIQAAQDAAQQSELGPDPQDAQSVAELEGALARLQQRQEELRRLEEQGPLALAESTELLDLPGQIAEVQSQLQDLQSDTGEVFEQAASDAGLLHTALRDLVTGNEEFRDAFKALPETNREAVEKLLEQYAVLGAGTTDQEQLIKGLAAELESAFQSAGIEVDSLSQLVRDLESPTQTLTDALRELEDEAAEEQLRKTGQAASGLKDEFVKLEPAAADTVHSLSDVAEEGESTEETMRKLGGQLIRSGDRWTRVADASDKAARSMSRTREESAGVATETEAVAAGAEAAAQGMDQIRGAAEALPEPLRAATAEARALGDDETRRSLLEFRGQVDDLVNLSDILASNLAATLRDVRELAGLDLSKLTEQLKQAEEALE